MTRVAVAAESTLLREILDHFGPARGVEVVAEVDRGADLADLCRRERPDVVLADPELKDGALQDHLGEAVATGTRVLVVADEHSPEQLTAILETGASGYLLADCSPDELVQGLVAVANGDVLLDPKVAATILTQWRRLRASEAGPGNGRTALTRRERELLSEMAEGHATKTIARRLGISVKTVENHKIRIFDKLGVRTQAQAISVAISHGLAVPDPTNGAS
jgi:DNA-binding NarL/FixJ family response regulator